MNQQKNVQPQENATVSKQSPNKSVTHFNWFARFETQQSQHKELIKS